MQAIASHIRACELAEVQQQAQPATKSPDIPAQMLDPWWTELKLRATINQVVVQENNYKDQMVGLFKEVEETDKYLTKTIKEVYSKLAKWRIRQLGAMQVLFLLLAELVLTLLICIFFRRTLEMLNLRWTKLMNQQNGLLFYRYTNLACLNVVNCFSDYFI